MILMFCACSTNNSTSEPHCHQPIPSRTQDAGQLGFYQASAGPHPRGSRSTKCGTPRKITDRILLLDGLGRTTSAFGLLRIGQMAPREHLRPIWRSNNDVLNRLKPEIVMPGETGHYSAPYCVGGKSLLTRKNTSTTWKRSWS